MYLYAIKELNTGLFVSKPSLIYRLEPLGVSTTFFKSRSAAEKAMIEKHMDVEFNPIVCTLAWNELERIYKKDRWDIHVTKEEVEEIKNKFNLQVVKLYLGELDDGGVHAESEEEDN